MWSVASVFESQQKLALIVSEEISLKLCVLWPGLKSVDHFSMFTAEILYCHLILRNGVQRTFALLSTNFVLLRASRQGVFLKQDALLCHIALNFVLTLIILYSSFVLKF